MMPGAGIDVEIEAAEQQEKSDRSESYQQAGLFSAGGFERENFAEGVAYGHYTDPWNQRVEHDQVRTIGSELDWACEESDVADFPKGGELVCVHAFEKFSDVGIHQVVSGDDDYADRCGDRQRQFDESRHQDHATADDPYHARHFVVCEIEVEGPGETED